MTEKELRRRLVDTAAAWLGRKESDGSHREIIDIYNAHRPLARGYKVTYTDPWCAAFVSAASIKAGLTDILPTECSCGAMLALYQDMGRWVEEDSYVPAPGDLMMYDWDDDGAGDDRGAPEHVGIVTAVSGTGITVLEGNKGNAVGCRAMTVNGRYIRGYCVPDYAGKTEREVAGGEGEEEMTLYRYVSEMPQWAQEAAKKAIQNGYIKMDETGAAGVWESSLQTLVWMDRAGLLDKPAREG